MAQRQFGNRTSLHESSTEAWGWGAWERLYQDIRLGARSLRKTPGFIAVTVLTLALGLGVNTAIFSVVNAVIIRSLPYPHPGELVALWEETSGAGPDIRNGHGTQVGTAGACSGIWCRSPTWPITARTPALFLPSHHTTGRP